MLFNSFEFLIFLPLVFAAYWLLARQLRVQNLLVVVASYVFYGWWDVKFLGLIAFTSAWSYLVGLIELKRWEAKPSKALLTISLVVNLGILGYFKYCNFFISSFVDLVGFFAGPVSSTGFTALNIVLPVGISFYTFQALSYTIDVYRRQIRPTADPIAFFAFPYFARDIAEFWRRWHMSLTTWFRDYLALDLPETCWYDANHLNRQGAETFTPRLAADLPTGR